MDLSCDLTAIFESLVTDELIPNSVENLSKGGWQRLMLVPEDTRNEQENFLKLAEAFQEKINRVILPIRLGIFALYSTKKVSIFNLSVNKILDHYLRKEDFQYMS